LFIYSGSPILFLISDLFNEPLRLFELQNKESERTEMQAIVALFETI